MPYLSPEIARCEGRTGTFHGSSVLAYECAGCRRRTADREVERVWFIQPPLKGPCQAELPEDWEMVE